MSKHERLLSGKRKNVPATPASSTKKAKIEENKTAELFDDDLEEFRFTLSRLKNDAKKLIENNKRQDVKELYEANIANVGSKYKELLKRDMAEMIEYDFEEALKEANNRKKNKAYGFEYYYEKALRLKHDFISKQTKDMMAKVKKEIDDNDTKKRKLVNNKKDKYKQLSKKPKSLSIEKSRFYKVVHSTVAIEGNSFELDEVRRFLTTGETISDRTPHDHNEVTDAASAVKFVNETLVKNSSPIDLNTILDLHKQIVKTADPDIGGKLRCEDVVVGPHVAPKHDLVPELMSNFIEYLNKKTSRLHPTEAAARVHYQFANIHPFVDGNGRVSRLLMNIVLQRNGYPAIDIPLERRGDYYDCLDMCGDNYFKAFTRFIAECAETTLDEYLK